MSAYIEWFDKLTTSDIDRVGGKNASLGEMIGKLSDAGVSVPNGFATTANAFRQFLDDNNLPDKIAEILDPLDVNDVLLLAEAGEEIRKLIGAASFSLGFEKQIRSAYQSMGDKGEIVSCAIRSSATAEDLPSASFAGQQETFLNVNGIENIIQAIKRVFASLYNDRAISYRVHQGFDHSTVAISVGIQRMIRSESGVSGVMFTLDTESGFDGVVFITSSYGLGETVVQGAVNPDEFYVHKETLRKGFPAVLRRNLGSKAIKMVYETSARNENRVKTIDVDNGDRQHFSLSDNEVLELARQALVIEKHFCCPMDIEWGKDGETGQLFILQARPETVTNQSDHTVVERYQLNERGDILCEGRSIGNRIGSGPVKVIHSIHELASINEGDVLVSDMTDPDWEPVMKKAAAIITNRGGRTCHAAIIARELGIPAVVGCGNATQVLTDHTEVTASCAEGDTGLVYKGAVDFEIIHSKVDKMPPLALQLMMNVANPDRAFDFQALPNHGVGLARLEFIINRMIGIHPKALLEFDTLPVDIKHSIEKRISAYDGPVAFYIDKLSEGISILAAAFYPKKVIVRLSDFKSNEYAHLLGGKAFEPDEENPMLGFRGTSRYISDAFRECFELECKALKKVRNEMGLINVDVMVPFCRTVGEAKQVVELLADNGLKSGDQGLRVIMMCEIPSNALLADQFLDYFDGFSIGSNDLTQLTLGLDRDSALIAHLFDERNDAVKQLLHLAIDACKRRGKYIGICGQGPSDHPDLARWLMEEGIDSISLNPDSIMDTWLYLANM